MDIILVRHGEPAWANAAGHAVNDPELTEIGHAQAAGVAKRLAGLPGQSELLVSTARRSRQTAEPIAEALGVEPSVHDWMHEIRLPASWDGTPSEEVSRILQQARHRPRDQWWDGIGGQGESFGDFHERVCSGLDLALAERGITRHELDPDNLWVVPEGLPRLVLVAHAGTNSSVLGHLLGLEPQPWEWERFSSNHASVTWLDTTEIAGGHIWRLQLFSGVAHFPEELVTG